MRCHGREAIGLDAQHGEAAVCAEPVDLTRVVRECIAMLAADIKACRMRVELSELPVVAGKPSSWPPWSGTCS